MIHSIASLVKSLDFSASQSDVMMCEKNLVELPLQNLILLLGEHMKELYNVKVKKMSLLYKTKRQGW